ncbi:hypothetical protein VOI32_34960 [Paraburkholderia caribensis]|uniref:Uncharacterized protein n=2 Tax=Paraburkholderia caribensis TaxID=75105 RepID=A0ABV0E992_9BURK|nr:hypothetical protein [Paraburkholderia caribensis]MCO4882386.1 hypothetical protein [Paraburkholderia caribensis]
MKVRVANEGDAPVRLIVDGDPVLGETLEAGAEMVVDGEMVELQDLEPEDDDEDEEQ